MSSQCSRGLIWIHTTFTLCLYCAELLPDTKRSRKCSETGWINSSTVLLLQLYHIPCSKNSSKIQLHFVGDQNLGLRTVSALWLNPGIGVVSSQMTQILTVLTSDSSKSLKIQAQCLSPNPSLTPRTALYDHEAGQILSSRQGGGGKGGESGQKGADSTPLMRTRG